MAAIEDQNRVRVALRRVPATTRQCVEGEGEVVTLAPTFLIAPATNRKERRRANGWYIPA